MGDMRTYLSILMLLTAAAFSMAPGGRCLCFYAARVLLADAGSDPAAQKPRSSCCSQAAETESRPGPFDNPANDCCCSNSSMEFEAAQSVLIDRGETFEAGVTDHVSAFHPRRTAHRPPVRALSQGPPRSLYLAFCVFTI